MELRRTHQHMAGLLVLVVLAGAALWRFVPPSRGSRLRCPYPVGVVWIGGRAVVCAGQPRARVSELLSRLSLPRRQLKGGHLWVVAGQQVRIAPADRVELSSLAARDRLVLGCPLDLNEVSREELDLLPGIGPKLAARVVAYRRKIGRFGSLGQLTEVRGIGRRSVERLVPLLRAQRGDNPPAMGFPCKGE